MNLLADECCDALVVDGLRGDGRHLLGRIGSLHRPRVPMTGCARHTRDEPSEPGLFTNLRSARRPGPVVGGRGALMLRHPLA